MKKFPSTTIFVKFWIHEVVNSWINRKKRNSRKKRVLQYCMWLVDFPYWFWGWGLELLLKNFLHISVISWEPLHWFSIFLRLLFFIGYNFTLDTKLLDADFAFISQKNNSVRRIRCFSKWIKITKKAL